ncbi:GrpB family protein [Clostridium gasigenes]|uniref:GrpB family protein n=1 Tax=Clostridium gasigenes TaxID=94869 RepID=UPI001C0B278A|nr:GrpB family protein [Clostridium gasigenes]MBU3106507.1 GrpB family protein [Clostridium gasigenes]
MIGLSRKCVKLIPYDSCWKEEYIKEEKVLRSIMGEYLFDIQHVGSTSIERLYSKPIIDIAVGLESLSVVDNFRNLLESVGYEYRDNAGVDGRLFFAKGSEDRRTHYLHIEVYGSNIWGNHIYFRNYLQKHNEYIDEYSKLKNELAIRYENDRAKYTNRKNKFITMILEKAKEEFDNN